ncbi:MAG: hypothetical protein R6X12_08985 [bacterium]
MRTTSVLLAVLCLAALAGGDVVIAPTAVANRPSAAGDGLDAVTIPRMLSYQGRLTDTLGVPVPDGNYQLTFRLYGVPSGGSAFWTEAQTVQVRNGLFAALPGAVTPIPSLPDTGALYLGLQVGTADELAPRLRMASAAYAYLAERAAGADRLQGKDTTALDARYVNEGQAGSVTSAMIVNGTIVASDLNQMGAGTGQVLKWTGSVWAPRNDSVGAGDNAWTRADSVLYTAGQLGIARGAAANILHGTNRYTHTNLGVSCTTGTSGQNYFYATVGGGYRNVAGAGGATVGGGGNCIASGAYALIGGGSGNTATMPYTTVAGGYQNSASATYATVGGGHSDTAKAVYGAALSGYSNLGGGAAADTGACVAGGYNNSARAVNAFVGGGRSNNASGAYATIGGGEFIVAGGLCATVGGGGGNTASGNHSTVGGGDGNTASARSACVAGGQFNSAEAEGAAVGGGTGNHAIGGVATVPGGYGNLAGGSASFAAGARARAHHDYSFVWNDDAVDSLHTTGASQFRVRAKGGTWFFTNLSKTTGVYLAPGANSWTGIGSLAAEDFRPVDRRALLEKVAALRVQDYKLKDQADGTRHIGPAAEDFSAAFGYGEGNLGINTADADGVLFAAVQALYEDNRALHAELEALKAELSRR